MLAIGDKLTFSNWTTLCELQNKLWKRLPHECTITIITGDIYTAICVLIKFNLETHEYEYDASRSKERSSHESHKNSLRMVSFLSRCQLSGHKNCNLAHPETGTPN